MSVQKRRRLTDWFIKSGVVLQVVFLLLVDWGSIAGILNEAQPPWWHIAGLTVVNLILLPAAYLAWKWMPSDGGAEAHRIGGRAERGA